MKHPIGIPLCPEKKDKHYVKIIYGFIGVLLMFSLTACGNSGERPLEKEEKTAQEMQTEQENGTMEDSAVPPADSERTETKDIENPRILIAYFSIPEDVDISGVDAISSASIVVKNGEAYGNTEYVARSVQETVGGDLFRIETVEDYPLDHDRLVDQAADEQDENLRPKLKNHMEDLGQYDTVILGFPNWWADLPMPVYTFLEEYDFSGKTIIPFVTHGGSGFSGTRDTISELQPDAVVSDNTLSLSREDVAGSEEQIRQWAESFGGIK